MAEAGGIGHDQPLPQVIETLRGLLQAADEGRFEVTDAQRAYLVGAIDTLELISNRSN